MFLCLAVAVLLAVIIILITGALAVGVFLNYKRTGSFIPSMPKLPRYVSSHLLISASTETHASIKIKVESVFLCLCVQPQQPGEVW